jgi:hypothetical protein
LLEAKELKTIFKVVNGLANIFAAAEKIGELEKVSLHVRECGAAWMASKICRGTTFFEIYH